MDHRLFTDTLERDLEGKPLLGHLDDKCIHIRTQGGEIVDPTGLIALVGTIGEIDKGTIRAWK